MRDERKSVNLKRIKLDLLVSIGYSNLIFSSNLATLLSRKNVYFARESQQDLLLGWLVAFAVLTVLCFFTCCVYRQAPVLRVPIRLIAIPAAILAAFEFQLSIGFHQTLTVVALTFGILAVAMRVWRPGAFVRAIRTLCFAVQLSSIYALICIGSAFWAIMHPYFAPSFDAQTPPDPHAPIFDVQVSFSNGGTGLWSQTDTVFDSMHRLNRSSAIVGFYHNYGAIFAGKASHIRSEGFNFFGILPALEYQPLLILKPLHHAHWLEKRGDASFVTQAMVKHHELYLARQLADTRYAIETYRTGFVFLHIGLPHGPWIAGSNDESHQGYLANLVLADDLLREIKASLERAGSWDSATVIITSDHNFRSPMLKVPLNQKVPLMIKLPNQRHGLEVPENVNAIDERWLIEAIATKSVQSPDEAARFMVAQRERRKFLDK